MLVAARKAVAGSPAAVAEPAGPPALSVAVGSGSPPASPGIWDAAGSSEGTGEGVGSAPGGQGGLPGARGPLKRSVPASQPMPEPVMLKAAFDRSPACGGAIAASVRAGPVAWGPGTRITDHRQRLGQRDDAGDGHGGRARVAAPNDLRRWRCGGASRPVGSQADDVQGVSVRTAAYPGVVSSSAPGGRGGPSTGRGADDGGSDDPGGGSVVGTPGGGGIAGGEGGHGPPTRGYAAGGGGNDPGGGIGIPGGGGEVGRAGIA